MASRAFQEQIDADNAAVERLRATLGNEEAERFAAELYKTRRSAEATATSPVFGMFPRWTVFLVALWIGLLETADKLPKLLLAYPQYEATLADFHARMMQPDLTTAQLERAKSEAKAAAYQPALSAAQAAKAEMDATTANMTTDFRSTSRLGTMFDLLDPNHPHMVAIGDLDPDNVDLSIMAIKERFDLAKKREELVSAIKILDDQKKTQEMEAAKASGNYEKAQVLAQKFASDTSESETKANGKPGTATARALNQVAWYALFYHDFYTALDAAQRSLAIKPNDLFTLSNEAHALMLIGRRDEAMAIYRAHVGEKVGNKLWQDAIADDFDQLSAAGQSSPFMTDVKRAIGK